MSIFEEKTTLKSDEEPQTLQELLQYFDDHVEGLHKELENIRSHIRDLVTKIKKHTHDKTGQAVLPFESF